jgi:alkanesulfonate monooxygenase SsuD/methylene tetrahydromethanopterin reductase-like flavin-dependent oxidoreductase (luciferase family)
MAFRGINVANFEECADPRVLAALAARAEERGWDGFFTCDHMIFPPATRIGDPWIGLAAVACATERIKIGALVTPVARRRIHKLARETASLDVLSGGRLIFGAGLGADREGELSRFGDESDARVRARLLDDGLDRLAAYWAGEFEPRPTQRPRIPVWLGALWPHRRPLRRALRWDGICPIGFERPEELAELTAEIRAARGDDPFDIVVTNPAGEDPRPWEEAGATWCLTYFGARPTRREVEDAIDSLQ